MCTAVQWEWSSIRLGMGKGGSPRGQHSHLGEVWGSGSGYLLRKGTGPPLQKSCKWVLSWGEEEDERYFTFLKIHFKYIPWWCIFLVKRTQQIYWFRVRGEPPVIATPTHLDATIAGVSIFLLNVSGKVIFLNLQCNFINVGQNNNSAIVRPLSHWWTKRDYL